MFTERRATFAQARLCEKQMKLEDILSITCGLNGSKASVHKIVGDKTAVFPLYTRSTLRLFDENLGSVTLNPLSVVTSFSVSLRGKSVFQQTENPAHSYIVCSYAKTRGLLTGRFSIELPSSACEIYGEIIPHQLLDRFMYHAAKSNNQYVSLKVLKFWRTR